MNTLLNILNRTRSISTRGFAWILIAMILTGPFADKAQSQTEEDASDAKPLTPKVESIESYSSYSSTKPSDCLRLGDYLKVTVTNLKTNEFQNIRLYVDASPAPLKPLLMKKNSELWFEFKNDGSANSQEFWTNVLAPRKTAQKNKLIRAVVLEVGEVGKSNFEGSETLQLKIASLGWFWTWCSFTTFLGILLVLLGSKTDILRENGQCLTTDPNNFSLGKTQMAFWFFLVAASFLFILLVTGQFDTIPASIIGLIGVSSATGLTAVAIDSSKRQQAQRALMKTKLEIETIQSRADNREAIATDPVIQLRTQQTEEKKSNLEMQATVRPTRSFWRDLVSDKEGISLHRFQMVVWTLILGFVFVIEISKTLTMPEFSATLLALMGASAGTYLGFKIPEEKQ